MPGAGSDGEVGVQAIAAVCSTPCCGGARDPSRPESSQGWGPGVEAGAGGPSGSRCSPLAWGACSGGGPLRRHGGVQTWVRYEEHVLCRQWAGRLGRAGVWDMVPVWGWGHGSWATAVRLPPPDRWGRGGHPEGPEPLSPHPPPCPALGGSVGSVTLCAAVQQGGEAEGDRPRRRPQGEVPAAGPAALPPPGKVPAAAPRPSHTPQVHLRVPSPQTHGSW